MSVDEYTLLSELLAVLGRRFPCGSCFVFLRWVFGVVFCIARSVACCLSKNFSSLITSVEEERAGFSAIDNSYFLLFLFGGWGSSLCLRKS